MPPSPSSVPGAEPADAQTGRSGPRWSSIERQLPLFIWALLVPTVVILALWAHGTVRSDLTSAAIARMEASVQEVQTLFERGVAPRLRSAAIFAARSDVLRLLRAADAGVPADQATSDAVRAAMQRSLARGTSQVVELWSANGQLMMRETSTPREGAPAPALHAFRPEPPAVPGHQPLRLCDGMPFHEVMAEAREPVAENEPAGPVLGRVVMRRSLSGGEGAELLGRLIGTNVALMLGNRDGSLWTDVDRQIEGPGVDPFDASRRVHDRSGVQRVGAGRAVTDTPWVLWVESDLAGVLRPADDLLFDLTIIGVLLLLLGGVGARWISRHVTLPLREATEAAEAIAAGQYDRRLVLHRRDEVGRLTQAFNTMAEQVQRSRDELEQRVAHRTRDLERVVAQLREAQDELVRQEKLAILGQLAGSVGHELRNPLGVMNNAIYYLEMVLEDAPADVREYLGILRRQISLSEKITSDLLDFTRKRSPQAEAVSLAALATEQLARLGPLSMEVERDFPDGIAPAMTDPVQGGQVVFNLLTNAFQALGSRPGSRLTLRVRQHGDRVRLEVEDNGPGVPPELGRKIFEPLFTTRARGIGLGLAVSRQLSENNGGELRLETPTGGCGACFVFELPAAPLVKA